MQRLFWKKTPISWGVAALILPVAALGLLACSTSHAQSKKDILGFSLGMPQVEVDKQLAAIGCQKVSKTNVPTDAAELRCEINKDQRLKLLMVKGMVSGAPTEVVKGVDFIFQSNDGVQRVIDNTSTQFGNQPRSRGEMFGGCTTLHRRDCEPGSLAHWVLSDGLMLDLTMNMPAGVEDAARSFKKLEADEYWLEMHIGTRDLSAEKELQEFQLQNRAVKPTPKF